ncbi:MAG TPA: hypothetical protein VM845_14420 [Burkholderiaceae bacterium]|jgi:hypothetical protein|nr:hypothetical protein [Burkholderiaceae bacterium]
MFPALVVGRVVVRPVFAGLGLVGLVFSGMPVVGRIVFGRGHRFGRDADSEQAALGHGGSSDQIAPTLPVTGSTTPLM